MGAKKTVEEVYPGLRFYDESTREWDWMWTRLGELEINFGLPDPTVAINEGEAWQYMGTERRGRKWVHVFRHRCHPKTNDREYEIVPLRKEKA